MNKLSLDLADNDELKAALGGKSAGDRVTLSIELMVTDSNDQRFEGDVESVSVDGDLDMPEDEEGDEEPAGPIEPDIDSPIMIVMAKKNERGRPKKDDDAEMEG